MSKLLVIENLHVEIGTKSDCVQILNGISLTLSPGKTTALVGESGSGKTTTAMMIMGLLRHLPHLHFQGRILYHGQDLLRNKERDLLKIRGREIGMVFQEPLTALNPAMSIGEQIDEVLRLHGMHNPSERLGRTLEVMHETGLPNPKDLYRYMPGQLSGGMKQRAVIAMAVVCRPQLIIADEPTTALDVTTQAQILALLKDLIKHYQASMLLITHDLGVVAEMADDCIVMYGGSILEQASVDRLFKMPSHPYTKGLLQCIPYVGQKKADLYTIPGMVPHKFRSIPGCVFHPRCTQRREDCSTKPVPLTEIDPCHATRCLYWKEEIG